MEESLKEKIVKPEKDAIIIIAISGGINFYGEWFVRDKGCL
jgi:hypothetical protein